MPRKRTIAAVIVVALLAAGALLIWIANGGFEKELVADFAEPQQDWESVRGPLIQTQWRQNGPYAAFSPNHTDLGCWSVAFAQVLAFHHLESKGRVQYKTSRGTVIDEVFEHPVDWDQIVPRIERDTPPGAASATARYSYQVATVVKKDFGAGEYMDVAGIPRAVGEHYDAVVTKVGSGLPEVIRSELDAGRPVVAYVDDILGLRVVRNGHAAVLDGVARANGRLYVHANLGWGGASDGWYDFQKLSAERKLRYVFRILSHEKEEPAQ